MQADAQKFQAESQQEEAAEQRAIKKEMALVQMQIESNERIKAAEINAKQTEKLMELAAGMLSAQTSSPNLDDSTRVDQANNPKAMQQVMRDIYGISQQLSNSGM